MRNPTQHLHAQVIESYSYFSLSVAMTLYLTDEFGISDLAVRFSPMAPVLTPHQRLPYPPGDPKEAILCLEAPGTIRCVRRKTLMRVRVQSSTPGPCARFQAGTYYGLWGMLATVYGFLFGGLVDWLGELHLTISTSRHVLDALLLRTRRNATKRLQTRLPDVSDPLFISSTCMA